jgi:hypothetical protein
MSKFARNSLGFEYRNRKEAMKGIEEFINNSYREASRLDTKRGLSNHNAISYLESLG